MVGERRNPKDRDKASVLPRPYELLAPYWQGKKAKRATLSLRNLARQIEVSPGYLSQVLSGKKLPSVAVLAKLKKVLEIDKGDYRLLETSLAFHGTPSAQTKKLIGKFIKKDRVVRSRAAHRKRDLTQLQQLDSWVHFAFLNLTTCEDFSSDEREIARRLGISLSKLTEVIATLVNLGLIHKVDGVWRMTEEKINFPSDKSHPATRQFHQNMMTKAIEVMNRELSEKDIARRRILGATLAIDPSRIEAFFEKMNEFIFESVDSLTEGQCTEVYQLNLQFVPLTRRRDDQ